jgi:hypothetical protein
VTVNKCPQFCRQVTGDIRQMRPAIHIVPVDDAASEDVAAKVLPGMLRYVEQRSDAKAAGARRLWEPSQGLPCISIEVRPSRHARNFSERLTELGLNSDILVWMIRRYA